MSEYVIYHNPRCSKSRQTLQLLRDNGVAPEIVEYLNTPPTAAELDRILGLLGMEPEALMRKGEADFKEYVKGKSLSRDEQVALMIKYPKLIERPIVIKGDKAVLGRPPENALTLIA